MAKALIPATRLGSKCSKIRVGINRKPGPTPKKPARMEIGVARISAILKFSG